MRLATRLWLLGALLPFLGTAGAVVMGGRIFRATLERAVDEALLGEVAAESVSMFDNGEDPHLHAPFSPLPEHVRYVVPSAAIYDPSGERVFDYPPGRSLTEERVVAAELGDHPRLATRRGADGRSIRSVSVAVRSQTGQLFGLQLATSLADLEETVASFQRSGLAAALALGVLLFLVQTVTARRLARRVGVLTGHMHALREGDLDAVAPRAEGRDEIAELARVVAEATEKLRRARASQDRLVADAAHELRTPLTLMRTSIDLALRRRREVPELVASLEETRREVDRLARLATRLLDLATAGRAAWDRTPGDLARLAQESAESALAAAEAKRVLVQVEAPAPVPALFDPNGIRQALDNLLANAVRHSPPGKPVVVRVSSADGWARLAVEDEGPGIPPEARERVFEPFERGSKGPGGAGLGLAIVREIARGHGGRAYVADSPRGALVVIELPLEAPRTTPAGSPRAA